MSHTAPSGIVAGIKAFEGENQNNWTANNNVSYRGLKVIATTSSETNKFIKLELPQTIGVNQFTGVNGFSKDAKITWENKTNNLQFSDNSILTNSTELSLTNSVITAKLIGTISEKANLEDKESEIKSLIFNLDIEFRFVSREVSSNLWKYKTNEINHTIIIEKYLGNEPVLNIPNMILDSNKQEYTIQNIQQNFLIDKLDIITEVKTNANLKNIDFTSSFANLPNLRKVTLSNSQLLYPNMFQNTPKLKELNFNQTIQTSIPEFCFENSGLETLNISNSKITSINNSAFKGSQIKNINLPETLQNIGQNAFMNCVQLVSLDISNSIVERFEIGDYAFSNSTKFENLILPKQKNKIQTLVLKNYAFQEVKMLELNAKNIDNLIFAGSSIFKNENNVKLKKIYLPLEFSATNEQWHYYGPSDGDGKWQIFIQNLLPYLYPIISYFRDRVFYMAFNVLNITNENNKLRLLNNYQELLIIKILVVLF